MSNIMPEMLESFGMEVEFLYPTQHKLACNRELSNLGVKVTYDASTETNTRVCSRTGLHILESPYSVTSRDSNKIGGELVTGIWNMRMGEAELFRRLVFITNLLAEYGEQPQNTRSSIHFHISFPQNLDILKKVVHLGAFLEKAFFTIGGMGYLHRGMTSDAVYYRPITKSGPLVVPLKRGWAQCFTVEDLAKAKTLEDFFIRYGDSLRLGRNRYPIPRYHWLNLINLVTSRNTLEIRVFNFSLDPLKILACLTLVKAFANYAVRAPWSSLIANGFLKQNSVFDVIPVSKTLKDTAKFLEVAQVPTKHANLLLGMVERTPQPVLKERLIRSHLHDRSNVPVHWEYSSDKYKATSIPTSKLTLNPEYSDFYTTSNSDRIRKFSDWSDLRSRSVIRNE